jgi:enamine deaminase RidA (YjgF/YER057c/UK114 family)
VKTEIRKTYCGADVATLSMTGRKEHVITVSANEAAAMNRCLHQTAEQHQATVLSQFVFAGTCCYKKCCDKIGETDWPVVWLQGNDSAVSELYSMQAVAVTGFDLSPVCFNGRHVGFVYEDEIARYCRLRGIIPQDVTASRTEQTQSAFEIIDAALQTVGFRFTDIVRTWIYLDRLLDWYTDFNAVRTQYFNKAGVFGQLLPASTGIGAANQCNAAIMMDVLAVQPKSNQLVIREVPSPLQNSALDYKSSFSRAVEMIYPTHKNLMISGTASINSNGETVYMDDPEKQIRQTMKVVHAILKSCDMGWEDLFRGIAYFKNMAYKPIYEKVASEIGIPRFPLAVSHADVCRHDLLFELEVDAVKLI